MLTSQHTLGTEAQQEGDGRRKPTQMAFPTTRYTPHLDAFWGNGFSAGITGANRLSSRVNRDTPRLRVSLFLSSPSCVRRVEGLERNLLPCVKSMNAQPDAILEVSTCHPSEQSAVLVAMRVCSSS